MAQPASVQANGVPGPEHVEPAQPASAIVPVKRKREPGDEVNGDACEEAQDDVNGAVKTREQEQRIRDYIEILSSYDTKPSIFKRPVPQKPSSDEPDAKRQKSNDETPLTIAEKAEQGGYVVLDEFAIDLISATKDCLAELRAAADDGSEDDAIIKTAKFKEKALELFRREMSYPQAAFDPHLKMAIDSRSDVPSDTSNMVLSVYGNAPTGRQLFSSLQQRNPSEPPLSLTRVHLPPGVSTSRIIPSRSQERVHTIGELFAPPRSLPPLQPPKQPRTQTKGNSLSFYHPELVDKSRYKGNSYFSQKLSIGHYLDYSNATPSSQIKTKQRERAQSLAGKKPSSTELEMSEFEALFRGAFSSFAPCKDDSAAVVPSGLAGRIHWQRIGQRQFNRMIDAEMGLSEQPPVEDKPVETQAVELDEEYIEAAIKNWDDSLVDPSLEQVMGTSQEDKDTDDILNEVTDMIETLASYQRIRNLSLPSSTSRYSGDPGNGDMLASGAASTPSEEETTTYEALKAQLALIIKMLPPHAVAKLNGDKLDELLVSTRIEVRTDQYRGVMEDDAAAAQAQAQAKARQQQAASVSRPTAHRTPSTSTPYAGQYAGGQYGTPTRTPIPAPQYYNQARTPAQQASPLLRVNPATHHQQHPPQQQRPQASTPYRPQNGFPPYATQLAKTQTPYGHQNMQQQYAGQARPQQQYYGGVPQQQQPQQQAGRYTPGYSYQQPGTPNYATYTNGQQRQVPGGQYSPQPQQHRPYGSPAQPMATPINRQQYPTGAAATAAAGQSPGVTGFMTVMPESQQTRMMEQAKARFAAQQSSMAFGDKISQNVAGLAGIGLGGNFDAARIAAVRANMPGGVGKPQSPGPNASRQSSNSTPPIPHKVTPVPVPVIPPVQPQQVQRPQ